MFLFSNLLNRNFGISQEIMESSGDDIDMRSKAREIIELRFRDASSLDEVRKVNFPPART